MADSLFEAKKFLEAAEAYEQLLENERSYSPAMLLKLAFVHEASGNFTRALYVLHLYYSKHPSRKTLKKMEALAQQHGLQGFDYSDYDFFATQARKYHKRILEVLMMASVMAVTLALVYRLRGRRTSFQAFAGMLLLLVAVFYYLNFVSFGRFGIVQRHKLALMSGPSAGSSLLRTLPKGNRLAILDQQDIWVKVQLTDTVAYVRREHLWLLPE